MPYTSEYIVKEHGLIFRWSGVITGKEVIRSYYERFELLESLEKVRYVIIDYTDALDYIVSADEIKTISQIAIEKSKTNHDLYAVAITPGDIFFAMARMAQSYTDDSKTGWKTYVFRSRKEAEDWLHSNLGNDLTFKN